MSDSAQLEYADPKRQQRRLSRLGIASLILALFCNPYFGWYAVQRGWFPRLPGGTPSATSQLLVLPIGCLALCAVAMVRTLRPSSRVSGEYIAAVGAAICLTWILGILWFWMAMPVHPR